MRVAEVNARVRERKFKMRAFDMNRIVSKLNSMMVNRFGVAVQYIPVSDQSEENTVTLETVKRNAGAPMIVAHNQLIVPIRVEGTLVGATKVNKINGLKPYELSQVRETIDLVLGEALKAQYRLDMTEQTLGHIAMNENLCNVIGFSDRKAIRDRKASGV
jgi:hypothetical protein